MKKTIIFVLAAVILLVLLFEIGKMRKPVADNESRIEQNGPEVAGIRGETKMFSYVYNELQFKPYVKELYSPAGINVLLDSPEDHKHHHGLMYAIKVDGINFWEEVGSSGRQVPDRTSDGYCETFEDKSGAGFSSRLEWIAPNGKVLLVENRTIKLEMPATPNVTLLTWRSELSLPEGKESAVLGGNHYHGLGMRFIRLMDEHGEFITAHNRQGEIFRGDERLVPDDWCAYNANIGSDKQVTVAMFRSPENLGDNTIWFTMKKPFAYLSATKAWHETPYTLKAGETLSLCYGVAVWDGKKSSQDISKLYEYWISLN